MANHKSALKRARQNEVRRMRNKAVKTRVRSVTKAVRVAATGETPSDDIGAKLNEARSAIDKAAKKGVIHQRTAARKISRLSKLVNSVNA